MTADPRPAAPPTVSIVVPAFNEEKLLARTLAAIRDAAGAIAEAGFAWELIVCDNNSTDRTAEIARAAGATVVFEPVNQISRARNTGARAAKGEWLLFIDADSIPSPELFADLAAELRRGDVLYGGALVRLDRPTAWWAGPAVRLWSMLSRGFRWMAGSFVCVEAAAFREVGGFNEALFVTEELDLSRRLKPLLRSRRKRAFILTRHRLVTSARKTTLYSTGETARFFLRALWRPRATLASREACRMWYDGRR